MKMISGMLFAGMTMFAMACGGTEQDFEDDEEASAAVRRCNLRCGDVDGSGTIGVTDAVKAQRFAAGLDGPTACQRAAADVDGDGRVTVTDAVRLQRAAAGLVDPATFACPPPVVLFGPLGK